MYKYYLLRHISNTECQMLKFRITFVKKVAAVLIQELLFAIHFRISCLLFIKLKAFIPFTFSFVWVRNLVCNFGKIIDVFDRTVTGKICGPKHGEVKGD